MGGSTFDRNGFITGKALPSYTKTVGAGQPVNYLLRGDTSNPTLDSSVNGYVATNGGTVRPGGLGRFENNASILWTGATGERLTANSRVFPASTDFTIEFWFFRTGAGEEMLLGHDWEAGGAARFFLSVDNTQYRFRLDNGAGTLSDIYFGTTANNTWSHIAIVRNNNVMRAYFNGVQDADTISFSGSFTTAALVIGNRGSVGSPAIGNMDGFRVSNTARYTANFTPSTVEWTTDANTVSLLAGRGVNDGGTTFTDAVAGVTWTRSGSVVWDTDRVNFGGSVYFPGGTNGFLNLNGQTDFALGTGDFTIAFWVWHDNATQPQHIVEGRGSGTTPVLYVNASTYRFFDGSGDRIFGGTFTTNTWTHIALTRKSGITRLFQNGTQIGSNYTDNNNYTMAASRPYLGCFQPGTAMLRGFLDEFVWIKGLALYDANFTVPSAPYDTLTSAGTNFTTSTYGILRLG